MTRGQIVLFVLLSTQTTFPLVVLADDRRSGEDTDRQEVHDALKASWDGLETLEFQVDEFLLDERGQPVPDKPYTHVDFKFASGGRRAYIVKRISANSEEVSTNERRNGQRRYRIQPFKGHPDSIESIETSSENESHDDMPTGSVTRAIWLLAPFGKPLHRYLEQEDTELEPALDSRGEKIFVLSARTRGNPIRCELDPDHDYLPQRVLIGEAGEIRVTRFERQENRWFPVEGTEGGSVGFHVTGLKINQPIPASAFLPPSPMPGTIVSDANTNTGKIQGGIEARRRLEARYKKSTSSDGPDPIVAPSEPPRNRLALYVALTSAIALLAGVFVTVLRRGRG